MTDWLDLRMRVSVCVIVAAEDFEGCGASCACLVAMFSAEQHAERALVLHLCRRDGATLRISCGRRFSRTVQ